MDREQRRAELHELLTTQRGKEEVLEVLKKHAGVEAGNLPSFGNLLVDTILNYEFPAPPGESDATHTAPPSGEPGDMKFDQPPGQEALGG